MAASRRARADQYAQRINAATELLAANVDSAEAARQLARRYRLSERQAWRYVEQARDQGIVEVPKPKVVFTVKLPTVGSRDSRQFTGAVRLESTTGERGGTVA